MSSNRGMGTPLRYDMVLPNGEPLRWDMGPEFVWDGEVPANTQPPHPMQQNDISITITAELEAAIITKIGELRALLDAFTISLTDEQRASYFKLGDARLAFDQKCDVYMHQRADLVPTTVNVVEYDKDGASMGVVKRIQAALSTIDARLADTLITLGADRLDADLSFYNYLEFVSRSGAAGADVIHADLKSSYPGGRRSKAAPPATPAP